MQYLAAAFGLVDLVIAYLLFVMPRLVPPGVRYGVRLPPEHRQDERFSALDRAYHVWVAGGFLLAGALAVVGTIIASASIGSALAVGSMAALLLVGFASYLFVRRKLLLWKAAERWVAEGPQLRVAQMEELPSLRSVLPWALPLVAVWALFLIIGIWVYPALPSVLTTHYNSAGVANGWETKTPATALFTSILGGFLVALFIGLAAAVLRTRQELDPADPMGSAWQQREFRARMSKLLLVLGAAVEGTIGVSGMLVWGLLAPSATSILLTLTPTLFGMLVVLVVTVRTGQLGSRLTPPAEVRSSASPLPPGTGAADDDRLWRGGVLYYNPQDSSILVAKRFGVGWTLNFASPVAWGLLGGLVALPILLLVLLG